VLGEQRTDAGVDARETLGERQTVDLQRDHGRCKRDRQRALR
jgi:hypothetical protein